MYVWVCTLAGVRSAHRQDILPSPRSLAGKKKPASDRSSLLPPPYCFDLSRRRPPPPLSCCYLFCASDVHLTFPLPYLPPSLGIVTDSCGPPSASPANSPSPSATGSPPRLHCPPCMRGLAMFVPLSYNAGLWAVSTRHLFCMQAGHACCAVLVKCLICLHGRVHSGCCCCGDSL